MSNEDIYGGDALIDELESSVNLAEQAEKLLPMAPAPKKIKSSTKFSGQGGKEKAPFSVQQIAREYTVEAIEKIVSIMRGDHVEENEDGQLVISKVDNSTSLEAAKILLDRGWGKATVKAQIEQNVTVNVHNALKELADRVEAPPSLSEDHGTTVDVEVEEEKA